MSDENDPNHVTYKRMREALWRMENADYDQLYEWWTDLDVVPEWARAAAYHEMIRRDALRAARDAENWAMRVEEMAVKSGVPFEVVIGKVPADVAFGHGEDEA